MLTIGSEDISSRLCQSLLIIVALDSSVAVEAAEEKQSFLNYAARIRSESVDLAGEDGRALTAKLRINAQYAVTDNLHLFGQLDHVESFWENKHSNGVLVGDKAIIADPSGTEINQLNFQASTDSTSVVFGRQSISFGEERFVGPVGFRQNDQTFDGIRLHHESTSGVSLNYAFVNQVNRILGDDAGDRLNQEDIRFARLNGRRPTSQLGDHKIDGHMLRIEYRDWDYVDVSSFAYLVHNSDISEFSHRTYGFNLDTQYKSGGIKWLGSVTLAQQEDSNDNWLSYYQWEIGAELKKFRLSARKERFGSNNGAAFQTPLATLHKFQGWADQFLSTPAQGLIDDSFRLLWRARPWVVDLRYHQFDSGGQRIGSEVDLDLIFEPDRDHEFKIRFADFRAESGQTIRTGDVKKLFLMYSYKI
ncbi:MAG: hypothetical protein AB8B81_05415 [Halioglobus sp.]